MKPKDIIGQLKFCAEQVASWPEWKKRSIYGFKRAHNMVSLEVGKRYMTSCLLSVRCVYMDSRDACSCFLMVVERTNQTFWSNERGEGEDDITIIKEIPQRQASDGYVNVYRDSDGELYMGEFRTSFYEANAAAADRRVGVVRVELVNNIETGEVEV